MLDLKTKCSLSSGPTYHMLPSLPVNNCILLYFLILNIESFSIEEIIHDTYTIYKCFNSLHLHVLIHSRDVLASPQILNMPDRVDWKVCKLSKDEEISNAKSFRTAFEPYDFNLWIIIHVSFICLIIKYLLKDGALVLEIGSIIYCPPTVQQFLYYNSTFWHKHRTNIHPLTAN